MRRHLLLITTFMMIFIMGGFGIASDEPEYTSKFGVVACGVSGSSWLPDQAGCTIRRRVVTSGNWELVVGVDGQVSFDPDRYGRLSPLVGIDYYGLQWGAFAEVIMPSVLTPRAPLLWRLGFTAAF